MKKQGQEYGYYAGLWGSRDVIITYYCYDYDRRTEGDINWCGYRKPGDTEFLWIEEGGELPEEALFRIPAMLLPWVRSLVEERHE